MRVLVADKDPYDLEAYRAGLEAPDLRVVTAEDGHGIARLALEHLPDVIVVASSLGSMGGFAIARQLKTMAAAGEIPELKVIVLLERQHDAWLAEWSRCDEHRTKPIDPGELERLVRSVAIPREAAAG